MWRPSSTPEGKRRVRTAMSGAAITLCVVAMSVAGLLDPLDRWLYDVRARWCQVFMPPPGDELVFVMVDDASLEAVGRWPWPRSRLAEMVTILGGAGAKVIAFDMLFAEPQQAEYRPGAGGELAIIDHDAAFAQAVAEHGRVIIPASFTSLGASTARDVALEDLLRQDPSLSHDQAAQALVARRVIRTPMELPPDDFALARRTGLLLRIERMIEEGGDPGPEALTARIFPALETSLVGTVEGRLVETQYHNWMSLRAMESRARERTAGFSARWRGAPESLPIPVLAEASGGTAFVDYLSDPDGVVRWTPLWMRFEDRLYPQLGLALALAHLEVTPAEVTASGNVMEIPRPEQGPIRVPVRRQRVPRLGGEVDHVLNIPWFGPVDRWQVMYDFEPPPFERTDRFLSAQFVLSLGATREKIAHNAEAADEAVLAVRQLLMNPQAFAELASRPASPATEVAARLGMIDAALMEARESGLLEAYGAMNDEELTAELEQIEDAAEREATSRSVRAFLAAARALPVLREELEKLEAQRRRQEAELRREIDGRSVLIGWAATGTVDFKPTPLHAHCPGVVAHAMVFNAIVTGELWRQAPRWVDAAVVVGMGLAAAGLAVALGPMAAAGGAALLAGVFAVVNGLALFDYGNIVTGAAAPLTAVGLVWAGCTLYRFVDERAERARITRRFRSYVDPALVDYVLQNPHNARLEGEERELTVVFTDLAGFTTLSEKLREKTVGILNEYMGEMVPLIRERHGYVNKFLGDGIMFFYGAPMTNARHASDAVATVLAMQEAMGAFNEVLKERGLPALSMRAGVSSGLMIVGDAGPAQSTDYTVLGDNVNLAARLESANKATGTRILINQRTRELIGERFLVRPIANLRVVGKSEGVMTYEPLAEREQATAQERRHVEATAAIVEAFLAARFEGCMAAIERFEAEFGKTKLTGLYRDRCGEYLERPPEGDFTGVVELTEK